MATNNHRRPLVAASDLYYSCSVDVAAIRADSCSDRRSRHVTWGRCGDDEARMGRSWLHSSSHPSVLADLESRSFSRESRSRTLSDPLAALRQPEPPDTSYPASSSPAISVSELLRDLFVRLSASGSRDSHRCIIKAPILSVSFRRNPIGSFVAECLLWGEGGDPVGFLH
ncbi:hypothetical protein B0H19DRAFT_1262419 [Mycena capillaripes]|nr:hypothetical protein B0H19DRAFT_1262419 [Mycena capillaripes]